MNRSLAVCLQTLVTSLVLSAVMSTSLIANTNVISDNGQPWDVQDNTGSDNGSISDGGQDAFDGWGMIRIHTMDGSGAELTADVEISGLGLTYDGGRRFATTTPISVDDVQVSRALYTPAGTDYMRYIDTFTNTGSSVRQIQVAWGGNLGSDSSTTLSGTSSGDLSISVADAWALTIENPSFDPAGPATDPPVGYVFQDPAMGVFNRTGGYGPFDNPWPGNGNDGIHFVFGTIYLNPGDSVSLAYFLYRGLEEETTGPLGQNPVTGEEIALAKTVLAELAVNPDFGDLSQVEIDRIVNWSPTAALPAVPVPSLSTWALLVLTLLIGLVVFPRLRKENKPV